MYSILKALLIFCFTFLHSLIIYHTNTHFKIKILNYAGYMGVGSGRQGAWPPGFSNMV